MERHRPLLELMQRQGCRDDVLRALAELPAEEAVDLLVQAGFPQYTARAVDALGGVLGQACERRLRSFGQAELWKRELSTLLGGVLSWYHQLGEPIPEHFDRLLAETLRTIWAREVTDLLRRGVQELPEDRRLRIVLSGEDRVVWSCLETCPWPHVMARAVEIAAQDDRPSSFPSAWHEKVSGLLGLGVGVVPLIVQSLKAGGATTSGRRVLVAVLWRLGGGSELLQAFRSDEDPLLRRLARAGLLSQGLLPPPPGAPAPWLELHALRASLPERTRQEVAGLVLRALTTPPGELPCEGQALLENPISTSIALVDSWVEARSRWRFEPPFTVEESLLCASLEAARPDLLVPWIIADALCRMPPEELDPLRCLPRFLALSKVRLSEVAEALGEMLHPEGAGNALALYDWLASLGPSRTCYAIQQGLLAADPRVRRICERLVESPLARASTGDLIALRANFLPIQEGAYYGCFGLFAIDHEDLEWVTASWFEAEDRVERAGIEEAMLSLTLEPPGDPETMLQRMLSALAIATLLPAEPSSIHEKSREEMERSLSQVLLGDRFFMTRAEAADQVEALLDSLGRSMVGVESFGVADVAFSCAWLLQVPSMDRSVGIRFTVLLTYLNDQ